MKNFCMTIAALLAAFSFSSLSSLSAAEPASAKSERKEDPRDKRSNLYEKVPLEGTYVGYAGVEIMTPGFFGNAGVNSGVTTSHGYMVQPRLFIGGGVGYLQDFAHSLGVIPIFAETRYFFQSQYQRRIYPHIGARAGAIIPTEGKAGYMVQAFVGIRIPLSEPLALNLELGPQYGAKYKPKDLTAPAQTNQPYVQNGDFFSFFARISLEF